jgi:hypothetical protein
VVLSDGNHNAIVFHKPEEGFSYPVGSLVAITHDGSTTFVANAEGVIPHRELEGADDFSPATHGLTWHFAK